MRYRMEDGTVVDTTKATANWQERRGSDGSNLIGRSSCSQWHYQTLYRSRKGRYYIEYCSAWQGQRDHVEWVSNEEATRWLLHNEHPVPDDLKKLEDEVSE